MIIITQDNNIALNSDYICWYEKAKAKNPNTHYKDYWCQIIAVVNNEWQHNHILGWYRTEEEANTVINNLLVAISNGVNVYSMEAAK